MTKLEILEETIAYYSEDVSRRAIDDNRCRYLTEDGRMCAYGRCMINPPKGYMPAIGGITDDIGTIPIKGIDEELKEQYRGHSVKFWRHIQNLHDNTWNWTNEGLSTEGKSIVDNLIENIKNGNYE